MQTVTLYTPLNFNLSSIFLEKGNMMQNRPYYFNNRYTKQLDKNIDFKRNIAKTVGSRFFTVKFIKLDGIERVMTCRLGVTKHFKGGNSFTAPEYLTVWEPATKGYRNVSLDTMQWIKCRGVKMDVAI